MQPPNFPLHDPAMYNDFMVDTEQFRFKIYARKYFVVSQAENGGVIIES